MDLKGNRIPMREILANPQAEALLRREFPALMKPVLLRTARTMTLGEVLSFAGGSVSRERIDRILRELETF